jgi:arylformamidase
MSTNQVYDVSLILDENLPSWPGDPPAKLERTARIEAGDEYNCSQMFSSLHWGTHVDAPFHFNPQGWTIDQIPLEVLMGTTTVIELGHPAIIKLNHLKKYNLNSVERLLIKTRNSTYWDEPPLHFQKNYTCLSREVAEYFVRLDLKVVGIDYLSIECYDDPEYPVHKILCKQNIIIIEGLDLRQIRPGQYDMICLPLRIKNGDGAPARILLR